MQDVLADPFALFIYLFILNEAIADIILAMSGSQPEDGDASNRPSSALSTCLHSLFSRWVMTLHVDMDLFISPCLITATKISTFLF